MGLKVPAAVVVSVAAAVFGWSGPTAASAAMPAPARARVGDLPRAPFFGVFAPGAPGVPADPAQLALITRETGVAPSVVESFATITSPFSVSALQQTDWQGAVPLLTVETWGGPGAGAGGVQQDQPAFANRQVIAGRYDSYRRTTTELGSTDELQVMGGL